MCAINPTHKKRFVLDVYTSQNVSKQEFERKALERALIAEIQLNEKGDLRWHVKESKDEAE